MTGVCSYVIVLSFGSVLYQTVRIDGYIGVINRRAVVNHGKGCGCINKDYFSK